jgi:glycolate oxidase FAD binding subunit
VKLMAGSYGTLGILSEVSFKVLPATESTAVLLIDGLEIGRAVDALSLALTSPFEVTGAAHALKGVDGHPVTMIRIEGFEASVAYRAEKLKALLGSFGDISVETDPVRTAAGWTWIRDVEAFAGKPGDVWRFSVKPSDAPGLVERLQPAECILDWGGGLVWALVPEGTDLRAAMSGVSGHATLIRAADTTKRTIGAFHPEPAPIASIADALRRKFDPRGILNPGLMSLREPAEA